MGSGNWIIDNLNSALNTWNSKMTEIWNLLIQGPETFKGGGAWTVIQSVNGALKGIGLGLLVLFFAMGVIKTCSGFFDMKRPEQIFKMFIRFALAQAAVEYGLDLLLGMFSIGLGMVQTVMKSSGLIQTNGTALPQEIIDQINQVDFWNSIPLWIITLIGEYCNYRFIVCYASFCIWPHVPSLYVCRCISNCFFDVCGPAHGNRWPELSALLRGSLYGGRYDYTGLCGVFFLGYDASRSFRDGFISCDGGLELRGGTDFKPIDSRRGC